MFVDRLPISPDKQAPAGRIGLVIGLSLTLHLLAIIHLHFQSALQPDKASFSELEVSLRSLPPAPRAETPIASTAARLSANSNQKRTNPAIVSNVPSPTNAILPTIQPSPLEPATVIDDPFLTAKPTTHIDPLSELSKIRRQEDARLARKNTTVVESAVEDPEPESRKRLSQKIDSATRDDCKSAYAGAGLLAIAPILYDAVRDAGCKW